MMEGQIPENKLSRFRAQVREDEVYYMKHFQVQVPGSGQRRWSVLHEAFSVLPARKVYRQVDSPYIAQFTAFMKIYKVDMVPPSFPLYAHAAVYFDVLGSRIGIKEYTSGLISFCVLSPVFEILPVKFAYYTYVS
jgi:hypothetical protein